MNLHPDNCKIWLHIYCKKSDCKSLILADLICQFQKKRINKNDQDKLIQCMLCSSNVVWKKWKTTVRIFKNDDQKMADFLANCVEKAGDTIKWFDFNLMDNQDNKDLLKVFNHHLNFLLRGRKINFAQEQILSVPSFLDTAKEFEILSENIIADINGLSSDKKKEINILNILNEELLTDENLYDKLKGKIEEKILELNDSTFDLILKRNQAKIDGNNFKTLNRALNKNLILNIFEKSIIGFIEFIGTGKGPPPPPESTLTIESMQLYTVIETLENEFFIKDKPTFYHPVMDFLRCLLTGYGQNYKIREFVLECMIQGNAKSIYARQQKSRFRKNIAPDLIGGNIDKHHFAFKKCHGSRYKDLLYISGGPLFIINGIAKALEFKHIVLSADEMARLK